MTRQTLNLPALVMHILRRNSSTGERFFIYQMQSKNLKMDIEVVDINLSRFLKLVLTHEMTCMCYNLDNAQLRYSLTTYNVQNECTMIALNSRVSVRD